MSSQLVRRIINSSLGEPIVGPYSHAIQIGQTLYTSGNVGVNPKTGKLVGDSIQEQVRQGLINLGKVLNTAGATYKNVVFANIYLLDMKDFDAMNEVYIEFFPERHPARATIQVAGLPENAKFEIVAVAVLGDIQDE